MARFEKGDIIKEEPLTNTAFSVITYFLIIDVIDDGTDHEKYEGYDIAELDYLYYPLRFEDNKNWKYTKA